ncbi:MULTISPECIES: aromatase/cyclase [Actinokineospora]|uniref:Actinorhodin polyketide synthase bifunctional cyclase/dehydratase n=1 Tax=Actinokineospora fastidiosa TaxID=1816 RepID=A0A918GMI3_9PSEU|nr:MULTISPECIES: aromatase/cyclase [Actinokineospora]UVS78749.1 Polyketide cyclase / dehydrase and lipid transport [Actinokineospora sp. UTMC 2448]GGS46744.1 actinorhodin polyketide synthase bifunctional cyclase/dehydratase [Actinokineospora fastidiosa]
MLTNKKHVTESSVVVAAPLETTRAVAMDFAKWPRFHGPAVYAESVPSDGDGELIRFWSLTGEDSVRTWTARRFQTDTGTEFRHEPAAPPFESVGGGFDFEPRPDGTTHVRMRHEFSLLSEDDDVAAERLASMRRGGAAYLESLRYAAENLEDLHRRTIAFDDSVFIAGDIADIYAYLYEADKWPERIPHVARLEMTQPSPEVQFFDMDTVSPDGSRHTTRSVRICLEPRLIVYKQTQPPRTLDAHSGHWRFEQTPEGVIATARHVATIKESMLHLFGEGTTMEQARKHLRRVLSANSTSNLRLAKEYAEKRAGY